MGFHLPEKSSIGCRFEKLVEISAERQCHVFPVPHISGSYIESGQIVKMKMPFDHVMFRRNSGRAICFNRKIGESETVFNVAAGISRIEAQEIIGAGADGAIAGLLIEATHQELQMVFWLAWFHLIDKPESIGWDDDRMTALCPIVESNNQKRIIPSDSFNDLIDFDAIIEATQQETPNKLRA